MDWILGDASFKFRLDDLNIKHNRNAFVYLSFNVEENMEQKSVSTYKHCEWVCMPKLNICNIINNLEKIYTTRKAKTKLMHTPKNLFKEWCN